jgi:hypothetical protein
MGEVQLYGFQLLLGVGALIEFSFKLIICITIPEEPFNLTEKIRGNKNHFYLGKFLV